MPAGWAAAAVAAGGAYMQSRSASSASRTQKQASDEANDLTGQQYNQSLKMNYPLINARDAALGKLLTRFALNGADVYDPNYGSLTKKFSNESFVKDPGYDFRLQQGETGINNALRSRGGYDSGAALKALARYNQDYASNEYQNAYNRFNNDQNTEYNRLMGFVNEGQQVSSDLSRQGMGYAQGVGNNLMNAANVSAAANMYGANTKADLFNNLAGYAMRGRGQWGNGAQSSGGTQNAQPTERTQYVDYSNGGGAW
jgi:hypothetical protein